MKNLFKVFLAIAVVATTFTACKRGEDDPGFTLRSRKGRFAGEWTVDASTYNATTTRTTKKTSNNYVTTTMNDNSYSGVSSSAKVTFSSTETGGSYFYYPGAGSFPGVSKADVTQTGTLNTYTYTIEKDGTWKSVMEVKVTQAKYNVTDALTGVVVSGDQFNQNIGGVSITITQTTRVESSGTWQFLGKNSSTEDKNKESVSLATTSETTTVTTITVAGSSAPDTQTSSDTKTYGTNENTMVWHLSMLKNTEMAADMEINNSTNGTDASGGTTTTEDTYTTVGKGTMTFSQK